MNTLRPLLLLGLLHLISAYSAPKGFRIKEDNKILSITVKGVELFRHSPTNPLVSVGNVQTSFHEHHGNWEIKEQLQEKDGLQNFEVEVLLESTKIILWNTDGPKVVLELSSHDFTPLIITWVEVPVGYDRLWLRMPATVDEHLYGAGEQYSRLDLRGYNYPVWTREQGVGRNKSSPVTFLSDSIGRAGGDYHTSYFPLPTFVSSRRYYCHISGSNYINLDFTSPNFHEISIAGPPQPIYMNVDEDFEVLVRAMTYFLWRQPQLPRWVHTGAILGVQGGTQKMLEYYEEAKKAGVKISGLWIQDWSGNIHTNFGKRVYWDWIWNQKHYPGLDKEIQRLKEEGVNVLAYVTPNLNSKGTLFKEAEEKGYFLKDKHGKTYLQDFMEFDCGTVDLTNPEAFQWYKGVITRNMIDLGFGGWMADFSEYTPVDVVYHNGAEPAMMHNHFPVLWARLNREAVREANKLGEIMFFMRAGGTGSQKFTTMTWAGDQNVDWSYSDGLPSVIPAALSLGMSGIGLTHFDIGLYTTFIIEAEEKPVTLTLNMTRSEELFLRSAELAVFTAVMRTHEGNQPNKNWQVNSSPETLKHFATLTRIYRYLSTYRAAVDREQFRGGIPLQRPLFLHYQDDPVTYTLSYQYMFGRDLLVAPVVQPGLTTWKLYLPADTWEHLFDGEVFQGPLWITVEAPIGRPPVFIRQNSQWRDYLVKVRHPDNLEFEAIPDPNLEGHCDISGGCI